MKEIKLELTWGVPAHILFNVLLNEKLFNKRHGEMH